MSDGNEPQEDSIPLTTAPGESKTLMEVRVEQLETEVQHLQEQLAETERRSLVQYAQLLLTLGETFKRQGGSIMTQLEGPPQTEVKLVPQEEEANEGTLRALKDGDVISLFKMTDGHLTPFTQQGINMDVVKAKFTQFGIEEGRMVHLNIYLLRDPQ